VRFAEPVPLIIANTLALAAIRVLLTTVVRGHAAALEGVLIAEAAAAGGIFATRLAVVEALALTGILVAAVMAPPVRVVVVALVLLPPAAIAFVGATLFVPAAAFAREPASFDEHVVIGGEAEISPRQRHQGGCDGSQLLERRAAMPRVPKQTRPVVEPAFVHALPSAPSLVTTILRFLYRL
jgi:hypothetical protein